MSNPTLNSASGSTSNTGLPNDPISKSMTQLATTASKQRKLIAVGGVILIAAALAASLYLSKRSQHRAEASEALFKARQILDGELKTLANELKPPSKTAAKGSKDSKETKDPAQEQAEAAARIEFAQFPVEEKLKGGVAALAQVADEYSNTLAGFDAQMQLGSLYYDHASDATTYEKAASWFEKASNGAPSREHTVSALYSLGYAQESLGKCGDAVKTYDRALNSGGGYFMADLLRAQARCYETLGDKESAKKAYEKLATSFPNTEEARFAELKKAKL